MLCRDDVAVGRGSEIRFYIPGWSFLPAGKSIYLIRLRAGLKVSGK